MKRVELYAKVAACGPDRGFERAGGGTAVWDRSENGLEDAGFLGAAGCRRTKPPVRPKLDAVIATIDGILANDKGRPKKQQRAWREGGRGHLKRVR